MTKTPGSGTILKKPRKRTEARKRYEREYRMANKKKLNDEKRARYSKNGYRKGQHRRLMLKKYGLTEADYERMFKAQQGKCAICGTSEGAKARLCVDHCHGTKKVRGLLCRLCNLGIGNLQDDPSLVNRAGTYLLRDAKPQRGDMILISWIDFATDASGDAANMEPVLCQTMGFFYGYSKAHGYRFVNTYLTQHPGDRTGTDTYPMACVERIQVIRRKKDLPPWGNLQ